MTPEEAIEIVARYAIAIAAEDVSDDGWEDYPDIGELDWDAVSHKITELAPIPSNWGEALDVLASRIDKDA